MGSSTSSACWLPPPSVRWWARRFGDESQYRRDLESIDTVLTLAGYILHEHYDLVEVVLDPLSYIVLAGVVLLYLFRVITWKPGKAQ